MTLQLKVVFLYISVIKIRWNTWQTCKWKRIARSILAAECIAFIERADCAILSHAILHGFFIREPRIQNSKLFAHNTSRVDAVYSTKQVNEKKTQVDTVYIKGIVYFTIFNLPGSAKPYSL